MAFLLTFAGKIAIRIWDAHRLYSITVTMWAKIHYEGYVAAHSKGSGHNREIAVDLTLIHQKTNSELEMGTDFDNFSDTAHSDFTTLPATVLSNRSKLKEVMEKHGFIQLPTEW